MVRPRISVEGPWRVESDFPTGFPPPPDDQMQGFLSITTDSPSMPTDRRLDAVREDLKHMGSVAICFSGGLDSTVLADIAFRELGDRAIAVMADVPMMTRRQRDLAGTISEHIGIGLVTIPLGYGDLPDILLNGRDRCYICKTAMYSAICGKAEELRLGHVINGEITDDLSEDRPGMRASGEYGIRRPFIDAGIGRDTIREYIGSMDLPVPLVKDTCMLMRYPVGTPVTGDDLTITEELEEDVRDATGIRQIRIRRKGDVFSVQTSTAEQDTLLSCLDNIDIIFARKGLRFTIDPEGYDK